MADLGKTTNRAYTTDQNVDVEPGEREAPKRNLIDWNTLYKHWTAPYRGLVPHGVRLPSPKRGVDMQFSDPETFDEASEDPEKPLEPDEYESFIQNYFLSFSRNVGANPELIVGHQNERIDVTIYNSGPGAIYVGQNENVRDDGMVLPVNSDRLTLVTQREIWIMQEPAQAGPARVSLLVQYIKEVGSQ